MPCAMDGEEWVDLFDDDSNDEDSTEPNPDDTDTALSRIEPSSSGTDSALASFPGPIVPQLQRERRNH